MRITKKFLACLHKEARMRHGDVIVGVALRKPRARKKTIDITFLRPSRAGRPITGD